MHQPHLLISLGFVLACALRISAMTPLEEIPAGFRDIRDPLLPPGYEQPEEEVDPQQEYRETVAAQITWPQLRLRGITHVGRENFIAILEEVGIVEQGEIVTLQRGNLVYAWRISAITAEGITTTRLHVTSVENPDAPVQIMVPQTP